MHIHVIDTNNQTHKIAAEAGWRVMEIIREAGLPIRAECGGCAACATCHVYVADEWVEKLKPMTRDEDYLLADSACRQDNSRLSCQIEMNAELDGLAITLAADAV